jgi:hypothetical protein
MATTFGHLEAAQQQVAPPIPAFQSNLPSAPLRFVPVDTTRNNPGFTSLLPSQQSRFAPALPAALDTAGNANPTNAVKKPKKQKVKIDSPNNPTRREKGSPALNMNASSGAFSDVSEQLDPDGGYFTSEISDAGFTSQSSIAREYQQKLKRQQFRGGRR